MNITTFDDLLTTARVQAQPQVLLLVFASATLPDGASVEQRAAFEAGLSGEIAPLFCVDKDPQVLADFGTLKVEAADMGKEWSLCFAAALSGQGGKAPPDAQIDAALKTMVEAVRAGQIRTFIAFDTQGYAVQLT